MMGIFKFFSCLFLSFNFISDNKTIDIRNSNNFNYYDEDYIYDDVDSIYINDDFICYGELVSSAKKDDKIYFIKNLGNIYYLCFFNDELVEIELDFKPYKIAVTDKIFISGQLDNDAYIEKRSLDGNLIFNVSLGGDGYEEFNDFIVTDKYLYVVGAKDAVSCGSEFKNIGQSGEIKSFITKLDKSLMIVDNIYFDNKKPNERITSICFDEKFVAIINDKYIYTFDSNFENIKKINNDLTGYQKYLINNNVYLAMDENLSLFSLDGKKLYDVAKNEKFITAYLDNVALVVLKKYDDHYLKKEPLYLTHDNYDINSMLNLNVSSLFGDVSVEFEKVDGYFEYRLSGKYDGIYKIIFKNGKKIEFKNDIIVSDYVNVVDNGIYKLGFALDFFGQALLDDEVIYNGHNPSSGEHKLVITDNNGNEKIYNFIVVDDYYKDNVNDYTKVNIVINKGSFATVSYAINKPVVDVIVNGNSYKHYTATENEVNIKFYASEKDGIDEYLINKIIFSDSIVDINDFYYVRTLKDSLSIEPSYFIEKDYLITKFNISDVDRAFSYVKRSITGDERKESKIIYKNDSDNLIINSNDEASFSICYDLGNGKFLEMPIFSISLNDAEMNYDFILNYKDTLIESIELRVKLPENIKDINKLNVGMQKLSFQYNNSSNLFLKNIMIISICLIFVGGIIGTCLILFLKNKKIKI